MIWANFSNTPLLLKVVNEGTKFELEEKRNNKRSDRKAGLMLKLIYYLTCPMSTILGKYHPDLLKTSETLLSKIAAEYGLDRKVNLTFSIHSRSALSAA